MTEEVTTEEVVETTTAALPEDSLLSTPEVIETDFSNGRPEDFPEEFWDADKNTADLDKLYKGFLNRDKISKDLRTKLGKGEYEGKPPTDIAEYTVDIPEALQESVPNDDPLLQVAREAAKEAGLPKDIFNKFMSPMIAKVAELQAQALEGPSEEEITAARDAEVAKLGPTGHKIVGAVGAFISQLESGGTFSAQEAAAVKASLTNADVVRAFNKLRTMAGGRDQVPMDMPIDPSASRSDIEAKMSSAMLSGNENDYKKYSAMLASVG